MMIYAPYVMMSDTYIVLTMHTLKVCQYTTGVVDTSSAEHDAVSELTNETAAEDDMSDEG